MVVVQPTIYIPPEISLRIATGELFRIGSVVRVTDSGRIFKHLSEVPKGRESQEVVQAAAIGVKRLRKFVGSRGPQLIVGALIVIAAGGIFYLATLRRTMSEESEFPDWIRSYNVSWSVYLEAIRKRTLDIDTIDQLISALDGLKQHEGEGKVALNLSTEQAEQLVRLIVDYTTELAEANSIELDHIRGIDAEQTSVIDMRRYLEAQRQIFKDVA